MFIGLVGLFVDNRKNIFLHASLITSHFQHSGQNISTNTFSSSRFWLTLYPKRKIKDMIMVYGLVDRSVQILCKKCERTAQNCVRSVKELRNYFSVDH